MLLFYISCLFLGPNVSHHKHCLIGKYAAVVSFSHSGKQSSLLGQELCQHIVGMNPKTIKPIEKTEEEQRKEENLKKELEEQMKESKERIEIVGETALLKQEYLLDPSLTVGDVLAQNDVTVHDFLRYECGEVLDEHNKSEGN